MLETTPQDRMKHAYTVASDGVRRKIRQDMPADDALLRRMRANDTLVVRGQYDFTQDVLGGLGIPHIVIAGQDLDAATLRPSQSLVINCPGLLGPEALAAVRTLVERGGLLLTTDWALKHVLEPAFPGMVEHNGHTTADEVVRAEFVALGATMVAGLIDRRDDPQWWLEASSYPIRIMNPNEVQVLARSPEIARKYHDGAIAIGFRWGLGRVYHMISHTYLQRTEFRNRRQRASATVFATEKGLDAPGHEFTTLKLGEVEAAYTSAAFLIQILLEQRRAKS